MKDVSKNLPVEAMEQLTSFSTELRYWYDSQTKMANPFENAVKFDRLALDSIAPKDAIEGMLSCHMVATHNLLMYIIARAGIEVKSSINGKFPCSHAASKLMNAFTRQIETLNQYRNRENLRPVVVGQVNVASGGQAVVGKVTTHTNSSRYKNEK